MFTTTNNSFGPTEISFLKNRFCNLAQEAKRYTSVNGNDPNPQNITEEKSELEEFIDYAKMIMGTFGHKVFEPYVSLREAESKGGLFFAAGNGEKASGRRVNDDLLF